MDMNSILTEVLLDNNLFQNKRHTITDAVIAKEIEKVSSDKTLIPPFPGEPLYTFLRSGGIQEVKKDGSNFRFMSITSLERDEYSNYPEFQNAIEDYYLWVYEKAHSPSEAQSLLHNSKTDELFEYIFNNRYKDYKRNRKFDAHGQPIEEMSDVEIAREEEFVDEAMANKVQEAMDRKLAHHDEWHAESDGLSDYSWEMAFSDSRNMEIQTKIQRTGF